MIMRKFALLFSVTLVVMALTVPAFPVSKEIVQLQTQIQALQDQMTQMRQSFDERMGIMRDLVERSTDSVNKVGSSLSDLQKQLQQQHADANGRNDQLSGQIQALNDSVDELKARMNKIAQQLQDVQNAQQNLNTAPAGQPAGGGAAQQQAPPPDVLYNNAIRDYNSANYQLAAQEFTDYLKAYPNTDMAGNAQFYLAEMEYRGQNYQQAIQDYDKVLEQYPGGNKAAAAQLKKGYALIELGQKQAGIQELRSLITRYPRSIEAQQARERLQKLGASPAARAARKSPR